MAEPAPSDTPSDNVKRIQSEQAQLDKQAAENALRQKQIYQAKQGRKAVVDAATGEVFVPRRYSLYSGMFDLSQNVANVEGIIAQLKQPGVQNGLQYLFAPVKESYGNEYIVPRVYGLLTKAGPANLNSGRLVIKTMDPSLVEKDRLMDTSPQRLNDASASDRNAILTYQIPESVRATQGDFLVWTLTSGDVVVWAGGASYFTMEVVSLTKGQ